MRMKKIEHNKKLMTKNKKLRKKMDEAKKEIIAKNEKT